MESLGGADTFFLVSDGIPYGGKTADKDQIVAEIKKWNATRKVKINTVAVGGSVDKNGQPLGPGAETVEHSE